MPDADRRSAAEVCLGAAAAAIRAELGAEVDAYPGHRSPEAADPLNRAFRTAAGSALAGAGAAAEDVPALVSATLRRLADARLAGEGLDPDAVRHLIHAEPGAPDDWIAFLLLSAMEQIGPLLRPDDAEDD
ncbi:MAG TPA: hypothetical protein VG406_04165 [Isosphaeraceae bacterium]|nr:hypothetical protein [Isosphaeraceae bacterium]